jgi:signal peptidase I
MRAGRGLLIAGFVLAALSLVLGIFTAIPAIAIGIVVIVRGRPGAGAAIIGLAVLLPVLTVALFYGPLDGRTFRVPSESMQPTLTVGERLVSTRASDPGVGDIVVVQPPAGAIENVCGEEHSPRSICPRPTRERSDVLFIERVAATPGDRVSIVDGRVRLNGAPADEPYIRADAACDVCNLPEEVRIPEDHYLVLGDNRGASADSRIWGPVPSDWIVGKVRLRYWPPSGFGSP